MSLLRLALLRAGLRQARVTGALSLTAALLLSPLLGACGTSGSATHAPSWHATGPGQMAGMPPRMRNRPAVEVEDDGIEAQRPPPIRARRLPDDPTEPYSPNYGSVPRA